MKLVNVRLGPEDVRMAERLRKDGTPISRVVREAIRAEYERHMASRPARRRPAEIMATLYRELPDPPAETSRKPDLRDRRSVRRRILRRLRRRA